MDFDFKHIAVPFRMQPGLRRMAQGESHLTRLEPASPLAVEKRAVVQAGQCFHSLPGFDPQPAYRAISQNAQQQGLAPHLQHTSDLPLAFEEDLVVLDGDTGQLTWLCVCAPSHWAPEEKLGLGLGAVHASVADNAQLMAATPHLVQLATGGGHWERFVWTITPSARYDQHPARQPRTPWPQTDTPAAFAAACYLRAERQTFLPVGHGTKQAVFTIRVMLQPLTQAIQTPEQGRQLHDSLASMSQAVLAYKNLTAARAPLLAWLSGDLG
ncbi:MAG: DUF3445 domain-containing protein [Bdellovibrionales bacterium]|nr:DUF3445 domain-containing protein [Ramlibacter sp.]